MMRIKFVVILSCLVMPLWVSGRSVDVRNYGASGDGSVCTEMLNRAIGDAGNGDTVVIPAGRYLTGTIVLKSHITLKIEKEAEVMGIRDLNAYMHYSPSKDMSRYDTGEGTVNANMASDAEWTRALILGQQVEDVTICGEGVIDGQHVENPAGEEGMRGPHAVLIAESRGVRIEGVRIVRAGNYAIMGYELEDAVFSGLRITEGWDGIHIRGGVNVKISDCEIMTGDDAIAGGYWENLQITGCQLNSSCNGIRMIEPSRNLYIERCHIWGPGIYPHRTRGDEGRVGSIYAIVLEPGAWGYAPGHTENVYIRDVRVEKMLSVVVYSMGDDNSCSGLYIDGVHASGIVHNTLPLNWQGGSKMWDNININNLKIVSDD